MKQYDCRVTGSVIRRLRLERGLTQEEMADRCELTKGFISQVERDQASPSIATLTDMLECLGVSLADFFSDAMKKGNDVTYSLFGAKGYLDFDPVC